MSWLQAWMAGEHKVAHGAAAAARRQPAHGRRAGLCLQETRLMLPAPSLRSVSSLPATPPALALSLGFLRFYVFSAAKNTFQPCLSS